MDSMDRYNDYDINNEGNDENRDTIDNMELAETNRDEDDFELSKNSTIE